ncbi:MAG: YidC/Oxa1 family membrane protein insertase [Clostridia bacterium]|nr:YidC/Oxa1 family membrane protein insertase [Clostridia bacterium]
MSFLRKPLGILLGWIYEFVGNYGLALILFTLAVKIILLPLTLKQQKSMIKTQRIQPEIAKLQEKYKNDKQLLSQETMKLYKEYNVSPMGGCLPMIVQLFILFALYAVIREPLTNMFNLSGAEIKGFKEAAVAAGEPLKKGMEQIGIAHYLNGAGSEYGINFNFWGGFDLSVTPSLKEWTTWFVPALAGITTYLSSKVTTWMNKKPADKKEEQKPQRILSPEQKKTPGSQNNEGMMKSMTYIMPVFTVFLTFSFPMAMGFYWIASNVFSILQTVLLNGYYNKKFALELDAKHAQRVSKQSALHGDKKKRR